MKKRILKRMGYSLLILSALMLNTACFNLSSAQNVLFYKSTEHVGMGYICNYEHPVIFDFENQKYLLERDSKFILHLKSADGKTDYLSFVPYDKDVEYAGDYYIKKIYTNNPNMQFLEIQMAVGAHGKNEGYWLIGRYNNKWVTYVSTNSLVSMGYSGWHYLSTSKINPDRSGKMILITNNGEYDDMEIELYWSNKANWIGMKRIR